MSGFTETIFSFLLGWVKGLFEKIWNLFSQTETSSWFTWLVNNWIPLVIIICVIGFFVDIIVWLFRWRPYYVWASMFRKVKGFFRPGGKTSKKQNKVSQVSASAEKTSEFQYSVPKETVAVNLKKADKRADTTAEEFYQSNAIFSDETRQVPVREPANNYLRRPAEQAEYSKDYMQQFARPNNAERDFLIDGKENGEKALPESIDAFNVEMQTSAEPSNRADVNDQYHAKTYAANQTENVNQHPFFGEEIDDDIFDLSQRPVDFMEDEGFEAEYEPDIDSAEEGTPLKNNRRKRRTQHAQLSQLGRSISSIAKKAGDALGKDEENQQLIDGLPPPVDKNKAFHQPVYPPKWQEGNSKNK